MQNDESIWNCIGHTGFCSFKVKTRQPPKVFCRNEYNVTGVCSRVTCPLANSNYATVVEKEGVCYLYIKTVERAHLPRDLWERVKLDANFGESLRQIEENLEYWPVHMVNRCKQRLTRIRQTLVRMRKLALRDNQVTLVPIKSKTVKRETAREAKAERAAQIEKTVQSELLERLRQGKFGIYNYPFNQFNQAVDELNPEELEQEVEYEDSLMSEADIEDFLAGEDEEFDGELNDDDFGDDGEFDDDFDYGEYEQSGDEGVIADEIPEEPKNKKQKVDLKKKNKKQKIQYITESAFNEEEVEGIIE
jgi:protein MAK16